MSEAEGLSAASPGPGEGAVPIKVVHLIRHAQSEFNAEYERTGQDPMLHDSVITPKGHSQVEELRERVKMGALDPAPDVVLVSPLRRALQTATGAFEGQDIQVEVDPLLREWLTDSCDIGSHPEDLKETFPELARSGSFDKLEKSDPVWWYTDPDANKPLNSPADCLHHFQHYGFYEGEHHVRDRIDELLEHLWEREEATFALVAHADFFNLLGERLDPSKELWLDNCGVATFKLSTPPQPRPEEGGAGASATGGGEEGGAGAGGAEGELDGLG